MSVRVDATGIKKERQRLQRLAARVGAGLGPDGAGPAIAAELAQINRERWETQGFGQWPPLSDATIRYRGFGYGHPYRRPPAPGVAPEDILIWTGTLRGSFTDPGDPNAAIQMRPRDFHWGTRVPYANAVAGRRRSQRSLTELLPEHERRLADVLQRYVDDFESEE